MDFASLALGLLAVFVFAALFMAFRHHLTPEARASRRRARSYRQVTTRKRGPTVKLAVDLKQKKDKKSR